MNKIKRLSLDFWMEMTAEEAEEIGLPVTSGYQEIPIVIGKDGRYFDRVKKLVWFESHGRAFLERRTDDFVYKLRLLNIPCISTQELNALKILRRSGNLLTEKQKDMLAAIDENDNLRDIRWSATKWRLRIVGE